MSLISLPQPAIELIASDLSAHDANALGATSRWLYSISIIYRASAAVLRSHVHVNLFCDFMLSSTYLPLYLRRLTISYDSWDPFTVEELSRLACIIRRAKGLRYFCDNRSRASLRISPELFDALATHVGLIQLSLGDEEVWQGEDLASILISNMASSLHRISMSTRETISRFPAMLLPHTDTLQEVDLCFPGSSNSLQVSQSNRATFPRVLTATLRAGSRSAVEAFARTFPNIRDLRWYMDSCDGSDHDYTDIVERLDHLDTLDYVDCGHGYVYFRRPIRRLTFDSGPVSAVHMPYPVLCSNDPCYSMGIMRGATPVVLDITFDILFYQNNSIEVCKLKYLHLRNTCSGANFVRNADDMVQAARLMRQSKLVAISFQSHIDSAVMISSTDAMMSCKAIETATAIAEIMPTLASIGFRVRTSPHRRLSSDCMGAIWFSILREEGRIAQVKCLPQEEGDALGKQLLLMGE